MKSSDNKFTKRVYFIGSLLLVAILLIFLMWFLLKPQKQSNPVSTISSNQVVDVSIAIAGREKIAEYITLNGVTRFLKISSIRSNVTGYITRLNYNINQYIKKGSEFCTIKTKEQDALKRIQQTDPSLRIFNKPLSIVSNGSGLIRTLNIHNGDYVSEGEILAEVIEPSSLILVVNVPYEYNKQIHVGTPCEVIFSDLNKMKLTITGIMPIIEAASQTQSYYILIPDKNLPENLNVTINLMTRESTPASLTIPISALQTDELEREYWVMKVQSGVAYKTPVAIGSQNDEWVEVLEGNLSSGDTVVTEGSYQLEDSTSIIFHP